MTKKVLWQRDLPSMSKHWRGQSWLGRGGVVLLLLAQSLVMSACQTAPAGQDDVTPVSSPPFYSPFLEAGGLTEWAQAAIRQGIGRQVGSSRDRYPENKVAGPYAETYRKSRSAYQRAVADYAANLVGGWAYIASVSGPGYDSMEDLTRELNRRKGHPQFAEALAAAMILYPELGGVYYAGGSEQVAQ